MTRARTRRAVLALLLLPLHVAPAVAIIGGTAIPGPEADAVVLVAIDGGSSLCSGALVAPSVVLTSAGCLADLDAGSYLVLGGAEPLATPLFSIAASAVHRHPDYDAQSFAHDVGVIELVAPAPVTPLPWLASDEGLYEPGLSVTFLGFGVTDAGTQQGFGVRRAGVAAIDAKYADSFGIDTTASPSPCAGDTGGPALPTESVLPDTVIGVSSYGDQDCAQFAVFARTDVNADFLALYAPEPAAPAEAGAAAIALGLLRARCAAGCRRARE